jgi:hypothetical protein
LAFFSIALGDEELPFDEPPPFSDVELWDQFLTRWATVPLFEGEGLAMMGPDSFSAMTVAVIYTMKAVAEPLSHEQKRASFLSCNRSIFGFLLLTTTT